MSDAGYPNYLLFKIFEKSISSMTETILVIREVRRDIQKDKCCQKKLKRRTNDKKNMRVPVRTNINRSF